MIGAAVKKCAAALGMDPGDLGYEVNLTVIAVNEALLPGQVLMVPTGRRAVVCPLTREEFDAVREYNARIRRSLGRPKLKWYTEGDRPDALRAMGQPDDPPPNCDHYYLCREV
jgi:hypothetical protein